ncbi:MAG TPA: hypothetical protein VGR14_03725 [Verrucomicrobiae bacterium]|jgi:hypothetical protein|nr:hypothetical protein [Verrucomicrobiae bacterium]
MRPEILIIVYGGVAETVCATGHVKVTIVDQDNSVVGGRGRDEFEPQVVDVDAFATAVKKASECEACHDAGWIGNGTNVERCDLCQKFENDAAAQVAFLRAQVEQHENR